MHARGPLGNTAQQSAGMLRMCAAPDKPTDRQTDRKTGRQTGRQTDRPTNGRMGGRTERKPDNRQRLTDKTNNTTTQLNN